MMTKVEKGNTCSSNKLQSAYKPRKTPRPSSSFQKIRNAASNPYDASGGSTSLVNRAR